MYFFPRFLGVSVFVHSLALRAPNSFTPLGPSAIFALSRFVQWGQWGHSVNLCIDYECQLYHK